MMRSTLKRPSLLLPVLTAIAGVALLVVLSRNLGLETLQAYVHQFGLWSPVLFVVVCALSTVLAPLSAGSVFVASGILFEPGVGFWLCFVGSLLGCSINFWLSRKLGRKLALRLVGRSSLRTLDRWTKRLQHQNGLLLMILVMPLSQDLVSYAVGLTQVKFTEFLVAATISAIAIAATYAFLGSSLLAALL